MKPPVPPAPAGCAQTGCTSRAAFAPRLCVPAVGQAKDTKRAIQLFVGLQLCPLHAGMLKPAQWLGPELDLIPQNLRKMVMIMAMGRAAPDFDRAWFDLVPLDHLDWLAAHAAMKAGRP